MKNKLKIARITAGLSQDELAKRIGASRPAISNIETGKSKPSGEMMLNISKVIGVPVEEIFFTTSVNHEEQIC